MRAAVYPVGHPYHEPAIGNGRDLDTATLADVREFFRDWYVRATRCSSLPATWTPGRRWRSSTRYFGPIANGETPERRAAAPVVLDAETHLDVRAGVPLAQVYVTWSTPPFFAPGDGELDLIARALTGGKTSRLYRRLVYDLRIAEDVTSSQASSELGSMFEIVATAQPGHTPDELLAAIDAELGKLRTTPVEDDAARARQDRQGRVADFSLERVASQADLISTYELYAHRPDGLAEDLARYEAVTPTSLRDAAARFLPAHARVVTFVTPTPGAPVCGELVAPNAPTPAKGAP